MKSIILLMLCFLSTFSVSSAQTKNTGNNDLPCKFKSNYNAGRFDSIYGMFSEHANPIFTLDKTTAFLSQLKSRYGSMDSMLFLDYSSGFMVYKAVFDKGVLSLLLSSDKNNAITALYVRPYKDSTSALLKRNLTSMDLPFKGEWTVFWGGDTKKLNFHVVATFQKNANLNEATGIKCYFDSLEVNGVKKTDYSPIKGDKIKEIENKHAGS